MERSKFYLDHSPQVLIRPDGQDLASVVVSGTPVKASYFALPTVEHPPEKVAIFVRSQEGQLSVVRRDPEEYADRYEHGEDVFEGILSDAQQVYPSPQFMGALERARELWDKEEVDYGRRVREEQQRAAVETGLVIGEFPSARDLKEISPNIRAIRPMRVEIESEGMKELLDGIEVTLYPEEEPEFYEEQSEEDDADGLFLASDSPVTLGNNRTGMGFYGNNQSFIPVGEIFNPDGTLVRRYKGILVVGESAEMMYINEQGDYTYVWNDNSGTFRSTGKITNNELQRSVIDYSDGESKAAIIFRRKFGDIDAVDRIIAIDATNDNDDIYARYVREEDDSLDEFEEAFGVSIEVLPSEQMSDLQLLNENYI